MGTRIWNAAGAVWRKSGLGLGLCLVLAAAALAQEDPEAQVLDLELKGATLEQVVEDLAGRTGLLFVLRPEVDDAARATRYTLRRQGMALRDVLETLFDGTELSWKLSGRRVTIERSGSAPTADRPFLEIKNPFTTGTLELSVPTSDIPR